MLCSVVPNIRGLPVKMLKGPSEGQVVGKIEDLGGQLYVEKHSKLDTMKTSVLGSLEFCAAGHEGRSSFYKLAASNHALTYTNAHLSRTYQLYYGAIPNFPLFNFEVYTPFDSPFSAPRHRSCQVQGLQQSL